MRTGTATGTPIPAKDWEENAVVAGAWKQLSSYLDHGQVAKKGGSLPLGGMKATMYQIKAYCV